jgi:hypothetical protein
MPKRVRVAGLVLLTWVPLVILSALGDVRSGRRGTLSLLVDYTVYVRFLLAVPVLVLAEGVIWPRVLDLFHYLVQAGVVAEAGVPALERLIRRFDALRRSWTMFAAAAFCVLFGMRYLRSDLLRDASPWQFVSGSSESVRSAAGWWYLLVSVPIFQFLVFLWACRYAIWCGFLFRLSRLDLALLPTHPDRSAGLRPIGQVHQYWAVVVFAVSSLVSVHIGLELLEGGRSLLDYRLQLATFLGMSLFVLFAPFLAFSGKLLAARNRGLLDYGRFAAAYTRAFNTKWLDGATPDPLDLLGTADIQSLADLANSYQVVHGVRAVPFEWINVLAIVLAVAIPFVPLVFAVISPIDAIKQVLQILL